MIANWPRLYGAHVHLGKAEKYKLRLIRELILVPLGRQFDLIITSGYRTAQQQSRMPVSKRSRRVSQHTLAEAVDFVVEPREDSDLVYKWIYNTLGWHQLLIYFENGIASHIHVSIPSEHAGIRRKALYNADGRWFDFDGNFVHRGGI